MRNSRVHLSLFMVSLFYAVLFSWAGQIMPTYILPEGFVWLRIITAALLFNLTALFFKREKVDLKQDLLLFVVCAFFGTAANMFMFFKGLSITKPINGAVLMMVTPLFVAIFDHIKFKKSPSLETILGLCIGTAGAGLLMAEKGASFSGSNIVGDIWVAVNAAFYAAYLVLVKKLLHKYHPITVNRITFTIGMLIIAPLGANSLFHTDFQAIPQDIWLKITYTLLITSFLVYLLNSFGVKHASPTLVGIYIYLQPILATIIALVLQTDNLTFSKVMFSLMILFGVWLVMQNDRRGFSWRERFQSK